MCARVRTVAQQHLRTVNEVCKHVDAKLGATSTLLHSSDRQKRTAGVRTVAKNDQGADVFSHILGKS